MTDHDPTSIERTSSREEVIEALRKFPQRGITNPDDLDRTDPEVIEAERMLDAWHTENLRHAKESKDPGAIIMWSLDRSMIYIDAGFHDPIHLDEVAHEWLPENELVEAESQGLDEVADKIKAKIMEIEAMLAQ